MESQGNVLRESAKHSHQLLAVVHLTPPIYHMTSHDYYSAHMHTPKVGAVSTYTTEVGVVSTYNPNTATATVIY